MARFNMNEADNYANNSNGGGAGFFKLADDGDIALVRFLYNDENDVEGYAVHEVEIDGKKKYVNCLREYNQPVDDCPFCREHMRVVAKLFVPLYNEGEKKVQVWERGKKFFSQISSLCSRYHKSPIVSQTFEIERNGKPKDTATVYNIYRTDKPADDKALDDYEIPNILGSKVLDKTADEMEFFLETKSFPPSGAEPRRSSRRETEEDEAPVRRSARRRTPANNSDTF